jgi:acetyl-CoA synthetase
MEVAAVESPDEIRGMVIKAFIVLREAYSPCDSLAEEIKEHAKQAMAPYKYPRRIEFVPALPKTTTGKIKRRELRDQERSRRDDL